MVSERIEMGGSVATPAIRKIGPADIRAALKAGLDDFSENPTHLVFLGLIYPIILFIAARIIVGEGLPELLFPLVSGCALIGPFVAIGLYELSRRREAGLEVHWRHAFAVLKSPALGSIALLGIALMAIFLAWLYTAMALFDRTLGTTAAADSFGAFLRLLFTSPEGLTLIVLGNGIGFLFALAVLIVSVVSFPMLLDRNVSVPTAVATSIRAVAANPRTMALWGLVVAGALVVGILPLFIGLAVVVPVLGHATWHLYRRVVGP